MKTIAIALARMGSQRVPGKVMRLLQGKPVLHWVITSLEATAGIDYPVLATSTDPRDDIIAAYCQKHHIPCFRGSEDDVLDRFYQAAKAHETEVAIRVTCDCPFLDPGVTAEVIRLRQMTGADYASNCYPPTYPDGLDVDVMTFAALETAWKEATSKIDRDCMTQYIVRNRNKFKVENLVCPLPGLIKERWVLDTEADWNFCNAVADAWCFKEIVGDFYLSHRRPSYIDILTILDEHPEIRECNKGGIRNERFYAALGDEQLPARTFAGSERVHQRALQTIPLGAQTFSRSHLQLPQGKYPLYATHGEGAYIFDADGNRYVDLVGGLLPCILGYCDPEVDDAVRRELGRGVTLSLATEREAELAELLRACIPCAEMSRFGKTGTDVTTAAVRIARAHTGRDNVALANSGYHGWADWSLYGSHRDHGVPEAVKKHTFRFNYGECAWPDHLDNWRFNNFAAVVVEPNDNPDYLKWLRDKCSVNGVVLIFDEIITGFRYDLGGAQKLFGVTPDLACFGKAMANGMPISALCGRKDIMSVLDDGKVFYSGTMFGETLSIAAAIATIRKLEREDVVDYIRSIGRQLAEFLGSIIRQWSLQDYISISGFPANMKIHFKDHPRISADQLQTLFMTEMAQNGVLIINCFGMNWSIRQPEMDRIQSALLHTFQRINYFMKDGDIKAELGDCLVTAPPLRKTA